MAAEIVPPLSDRAVGWFHVGLGIRLAIYFVVTVTSVSWQAWLLFRLGWRFLMWLAVYLAMTSDWWIPLLAGKIANGSFSEWGAMASPSYWLIVLQWPLLIGIRQRNWVWLAAWGATFLLWNSRFAEMAFDGVYNLADQISPWLPTSWWNDYEKLSWVL